MIRQHFICIIVFIYVLIGALAWFKLLKYPLRVPIAG